MVADLAIQFESEVAESRTLAARQTAESLNQVLRRLRQAPAEAQTLQAIADGTAAWSQHLVVLAVESNQFRLVAGRAVSGLRADFAVSTDGAPALAACAESKDPVTVLCSESEFGPALAEALAANAKAWLFPVVVRQQTALILLASGEVSAAALELIAEAAGLRLESQRAPTLPLNPLVSGSTVSAPDPGSSAARTPRAWEDLSQDEQSQHLLAQRVARVRVAQMRLADPAGLERAVFSGNIYSAFRAAIDQAREDFLHQHLAKTTTMVDYLHLEILRSLAHDDERLLGADYPGPMA
jgi:hypothetical protein